jgi:hypothetical protein
VNLKIFPGYEFEELRGEDRGKGAASFTWNFE